MVNKNADMVIGFSGSRSNSFIGAFYGYLAADGRIPHSPLILNTGHGVYAPPGTTLLARWGDYSYTTLDPIDSLTFWTVQQYADEDLEDHQKWGTWISEIVPDVLTP
jgi:hypothetical protein